MTDRMLGTIRTCCCLFSIRNRSDTAQAKLKAMNSNNINSLTYISKLK